jgi:serine/threonine protein kinase
VKPANIRLDDRVALTDFGVAVIEGAARPASVGRLIGSLVYLAPERSAGSTPALRQICGHWAVTGLSFPS